MTESERLKQTITELESQRETLGNELVDAAIAPMKQRLEELIKEKKGSFAAFEAERKLVTIMFADISGFTTLAETMDPEAVRDLINACFGRLVPVVEKYGGMVDKFIGDEIMALFGAPLAHEDDPERSLRAALEMMTELEYFNNEYECDLGIHMGINTGLVIAGGIGSEGRQQYSVMGDPVNLAARLENASERGEIFVGPDTHRLISSLFDFDALEPMRVKGKAKPVAVYRLLGLSDSPRRREGIPGLHSPLVGREAERRKLKTVIKKLKEGTGGKMAIIGEAGLGKSRLVTELKIESKGSVRWYEGRAFSYTRDTSYHPVREMIFELIGVALETPPGEVGSKLMQALTKDLPGHAGEIFPYIARLLDVPMDEPAELQIKFLTPEALKGRIVQAIYNWLKARATNVPHVIVWEDMHWADSSSLNLLEALLHLTNEVGLLLIFVFRPRKGEKEWLFHQKLIETYGKEYQVIKLDPLSQESSVELVHNLIKIDKMPEKIQHIILEKAEGNPFFLEELLRSLIDSGIVILKDKKATTTTNITTLDIPDTVQEVITARIDHLPGEDKRTLQTASVIGRVFQHRVLSHIMEDERFEIQIITSLNELKHREFICPYESKENENEIRKSDLEYIFKHVIIQEVAYNSMLLAQRKTLHKVAAETIISMFPDNLDEFAASLAHHYQKAELHEDAIMYLKRAADREKAIHANNEAITFYKNAIEQVSRIMKDTANTTDQWKHTYIQLHESLGELLALTGLYKEARNAFQEALIMILEDEPVWRARLHLRIGGTWAVQKSYEEAEKAYDHSVESLNQEDGVRGKDWWQALIDIQCERMELYYWQNKLKLMTELAEKAQSVTEQYGSPIQQARFFNGLALMTFRRDRYLLSNESFGYTEKAVAACENSDNYPVVSWSKFLMGFGYLWGNRLQDAEEPLLQSLALTEKTGDIVTQSRCLAYLTVLYRRRNEIEKVKILLPRCFETASSASMIEYTGTAWANQSWLQYKEANYSDARKSGHMALDIWHKVLVGHATRSVVHWMACCQLIEMESGDGNSTKAVEIAKIIMDPLQKKLPDKLSAAYLEGINAWEEGSSTRSLNAFRQAGILAREMNYL